jgi:hypothetical protein
LWYNSLQMPRKPKFPTIEVGTTGLKRGGGLVQEEFIRKLQGQQAIKVYTEMSENDPTIGAALYAITAFLRSVKWTAKRPRGNVSNKAKAAQKYLQEVMTDMERSWEDAVDEILTMLIFGHAVLEPVFKIRKDNNSKYPDGKVGLRYLAPRGQETISEWDIDAQGNILGLTQSAYPNYIPTYIARQRFLLFRTRSVRNNPEGRSILRSAYRPWFFKKRLEEVESIGIARDMTGIPVFEVPVALLSANASPTQKATVAHFEKLASQLHRDEREGMVIPTEADSEGKPTGYKLRLLSSAGPKQIIPDPVIRRYDVRIAMSMMAEGMLLGSERSGGSYSLAEEKSSSFSRSLLYILDIVEQEFNANLAEPLQMASGFKPKDFARWRAGSVTRANIDQLSKTISNLVTAGLFRPTEDDEHHMRDLADLPEFEDDKRIKPDAEDDEDDILSEESAGRKTSSDGGGSST